MADIDLLLEAERRGLLPQDKIEALQEARTRGLVPAALSNGQDENAAPAASSAAPAREIPTIDPFPLIPTTQKELESVGQTAKGLYKGAIEDPLFGSSQLLAHGAAYASDLGGRAPNQVSGFLGQSRDALDRMMAAREADYQAQRRTVNGGEDLPDVARGIGMVASPANFLTAEAAAPASNFLAQRLGNNLLSRGISGAGTGAAIASEQPVYGGDYGAEKLNQAEGGAIAGGALESAASAISPFINRRAQRLADLGVPTTLGQNLGPFASRVEEISQSVPGSGMVVRGARERANEGLNRVVANEALGPIGKTVNPETAAGRPLMKEVNDKIDAAYDHVLPQLHGQVDPQLQADIARIRESLPPKVQQDFDGEVKRHLLDREDENGNIVGHDNKKVDIDLRDKSISLQRDGDTWDKDLGQGLRNVRDAVRDMWGRYNPRELTHALKAADQSYGLGRIMERASSSVGAPDGVFNASHLQSAVKAQDITAGKEAFTTGQARLSRLADDAKAVMGSKVNDSGTPERAALMSVLQHGGNVATGLGALAGSIPPQAIAGMGAHALLYTRAGQNALRYLAAGSPATRNALAQGIRRASPAVINALAPQIAPQ